ncbi:hypothetical protein AB1J28_05795 [Lysinibacillus irui]|uniref:hypothetical protein n=1 Tax=Lysinibacillus irui TaxID=2998077 RepID=UPI003D29EBF4
MSFINTDTSIQDSSSNPTLDSSSNLTNGQVLEFPSSHVLLETIRHEYDIEASRKRDIETRAGILIALSGALIGFYTTSLDFKILKNASTSLEYLGAVTLCIIYLLPTVTLLIALSNYLKILDAKSYNRVGLGGFNDEMGQKNSDEVSMRLTKVYSSVIKNNHEVNENKAKQFKKGITFMYISLISVIIVYILKQIISLIL